MELAEKNPLNWLDIGNLFEEFIYYSKTKIVNKIKIIYLKSPLVSCKNRTETLRKNEIMKITKKSIKSKNKNNF